MEKDTSYQNFLKWKNEQDKKEQKNNVERYDNEQIDDIYDNQYAYNGRIYEDFEDERNYGRYAPPGNYAPRYNDYFYDNDDYYDNYYNDDYYSNDYYGANYRAGDYYDSRYRRDPYVQDDYDYEYHYRRQAPPPNRERVGRNLSRSRTFAGNDFHNNYRAAPPVVGRGARPPPQKRVPPPQQRRLTQPPQRRGPPPQRRGPPPQRRGPPPHRRGPPPQRRRGPPRRAYTSMQIPAHYDLQRAPPNFRNREPDDYDDYNDDYDNYYSPKQRRPKKTSKKKRSNKIRTQSNYQPEQVETEQSKAERQFEAEHFETEQFAQHEQPTYETRKPSNSTNKNIKENFEQQEEHFDESQMDAVVFKNNKFVFGKLAAQEYKKQRPVRSIETYNELTDKQIPEIVEKYSINSSLWIEAFKNVDYNNKKKGKKLASALRRLVDEESKVICEQLYFTLNAAPKKGQKVKRYFVQLPKDQIISSINGTKIYDEHKMLSEHELKSKYNKYDANANIRLLRKDAITAGLYMKKKGLNPVILMFASEKSPGDNPKGNIGQEGDIYRRTTIMYNLDPTMRSKLLPESKFAYSMRTYGGIYCPDVIVFRKHQDQGYGFRKPSIISFIAAPPLARPKLKDKDEKGKFFSEKSDIDKYQRKLRSVLAEAFDRGHDSIVLGAWGCGYSKVPAVHVTKIIGGLIASEFVHAFKEIAFAVIDDRSANLAHNAPFGSNYKVFKDFVDKVRDNKLKDKKCVIF